MERLAPERLEQPKSAKRGNCTGSAKSAVAVWFIVKPYVWAASVTSLPMRPLEA